LRSDAHRNAWRAAVLLCACSGPASAADSFKVRFPLSGTFGGEIVAPLDKPGWFGSIAATHVDLDKVTDETGNARRDTFSGTFTTPQPIAGVQRSADFTATVETDGQRRQNQTNLLLGYQFEPKFAGGRFSVAFNLPYTVELDQTLRVSGATPTLSPLTPGFTSPPFPTPEAAAQVAAQAQAAAQAGFAAGFQANLAAQSAAGTGEIDGFGDAEISLLWSYQQDRLKVISGLTLAMPTAEYDASSSVNVGFGNFYTLRPGMAVIYSPFDQLTVGARASLGFNTRNKDNDIKSGNFAALDLAAALRTPIGVIGPHVLHVQQYQDDSGGMFGANRFRATGAGLFMATLIPALGTGINFSYMQMIESRNALSGSFLQLRVSKVF
jgi:hypothetical protein